MAFLKKLFGGTDISALQAKGDVEKLIAILGDPKCDAALRAEAAGALGAMGDGAAATALAAELETEGVAAAARTALSDIGEPAAKALATCIVKACGPPRDDPGMREMAKRALIGMGPLASQGIVAFLSDKQGRTTNDKALQILVTMLDDLKWQPDTSVAAALYHLQKDAWDKLVGVGPAAVGPLRTILGDYRTSIDDKQTSLRILGEIGGPKAAQVVVSIYMAEARGRGGEHEQDWETPVRMSARDALLQIGKPHAVKPLESAIEKAIRRRDTVAETRGRAVLERL